MERGEALINSSIGFPNTPPSAPSATVVDRQGEMPDKIVGGSALEVRIEAPVPSPTAVQVLRGKKGSKNKKSGKFEG